MGHQMEAMPVNSLASIKQMTLREQLIDRQRWAEKVVKETTEALKVLDENPGFEKIQDLVKSIGIY